MSRVCTPIEDDPAGDHFRNGFDESEIDVLMSWIIINKAILFAFLVVAKKL